MKIWEKILQAEENAENAFVDTELRLEALVTAPRKPTMSKKFMEHLVKEPDEPEHTWENAKTKCPIVLLAMGIGDCHLKG